MLMFMFMYMYTYVYVYVCLCVFVCVYEELEHVLIEILLEEAQADHEKILNGILTKDHVEAVTLLFNGRTGNDYNAMQISGKFKRLKKRYYAFSHLIRRSDVVWDSNRNRISGSKDAWAKAEVVSIIHLINFHAVHSLNSSCKQSNIYQCL